MASPVQAPQAPPGRRRVALVATVAVACAALSVVLANELLQQWIAAGHSERVTVAERFLERGAEGTKTEGAWVIRADGQRQQLISNWLFDETRPGDVLEARTTRTGSHDVIAIRSANGTWQEIRSASAASFLVLILSVSGLVACLRSLLRRRRPGSEGIRPPAARPSASS